MHVFLGFATSFKGLRCIAEERVFSSGLIPASKNIFWSHFMCGIVGAVGLEDCSETLLDSLKRLEYRGYDSSGVVTQDGDSFEMRRAVGKLKHLAQLMHESPLKGHSGLGHTRWATHGGVSERNAHPHIAGDKVVIVHNGIIENHVALRGELETAGHKFASETDSEVLAHLFLAAFNDGLSPCEAGVRVLSMIEGTFALAAMHIDHPDMMIVARNASPLAIGIGDGAGFVGSDAVALAHLTRNVIYLKIMIWLLFVRMALRCSISRNAC